MTPLRSTFSLDINATLDWEAMERIVARGHSRIPVYDGDERNLVGVLQVKSLLTVRPEAGIPISAVTIRKIPKKVGAILPAVTKVKSKKKANKKPQKTDASS